MSGGLVVVGSGPAAHAAVVAYRDHGGVGPVTMISADDRHPYNRPPLSKDYLRGESTESELLLESAQFYAERGVELRLNTTVATLDPAGRRITIDGNAQVDYDTLILATGARPRVLDVPGGADGRVHYLRSAVDSTTLKARAAAAERAVVIGSGFIGCEAAASLALRGLTVTLVTQEDVPQAARLGAEAGARIQGWLEALGVNVVTGAKITRITDGHTVEIEGRDAVSGDLVLVAGGVEANVELASAAGLQIDDGRISVDAGMRTSADGILAAGDVVRAHNPGAGRSLAVEHWGEAEAMGRVVGANAADPGAGEQWDEVPGFWSEIGPYTLKYAAWGDGYDHARFVAHDSTSSDGAFTVWYEKDGEVVGVLTYEADDDYERGSDLVAAHTPFTHVDAEQETQ